MIKALLFDVDGTLIDSLDDLEIACKQMMQSLNLAPLSRDEVSRFIGKGARILVIRALNARLGRTPTDEEIDQELSDLAEEYNMETDAVEKALSKDMLAHDVEIKKAVDLIADSAKQDLPADED